jgi:hypothetical protein
LLLQRPRTPHQSAELQANPKRSQYADALDEIMRRISAGGDLMPFLSRGIKTPYEPITVRKAKMHQRKHRDLLLADWGIHHLHLSTTIEHDGFVKRTRDLLFAIFASDDAYLLDIYGHGDWVLHAVVEVAVRNWPRARIFREIHGVVGLSQQYSDEDRLELRKAGVAQLLEIDGKVYMPPGQTTAGTPLDVTLRVNELMWELQRLRELGDLKPVLDAAAAGKGATGTWKAAVQDDFCGFGSGAVFIAVRPLS